MDALELNYPVAAATAPDLLGVGGGDRVTMVDTEVDLCSSLISEKDMKSSVKTSELKPLDKVPAPELCQHTSQQTSFPCEDVSKQLHFGSAKVPSWIPRHEEVQVQRKEGKASRSGNGCCKRPRLVLSEDNTGTAAIDSFKDASSKQGSHPVKSDLAEKTHSVKQRNNFSSKRGDRRNLKCSTKTKYDSFSIKASFASFGSAAAGSDFFELYGLKTDVHDITKLVDDLSLNDLLQGTYDRPHLGKDKGKKATNTTENILHSVRKVCSILQPPMSAQSQGVSEIDSCSNEKRPTYQSSSNSILGNGDISDSSMADLSSSNKDASSKLESSADLLNYFVERPSDTLERLTLPPPKDLEALLLDAAKPAASSRNIPDPRLNKQASRRPSLPPFPWSHTFGGNCRTNSDAAKLLTSRGTCQGRWVKVVNGFNSPGVKSVCFRDLESLAYDDTLVPSCGRKLTATGNTVASLSFVPGQDCGSSMSAISSVIPHTSVGSSFFKDSGTDLKNHEEVEQCPRLLAAAQTLYDIATSTPTLNQNGKIKCPNKSSQKVTKACKSKSTETDIFAPSTSTMRSDQTARNSVDNALISKKLKLSTIESRKDILHINGVRKGPISWSAPKSSRSSPNKSIRDSTDYIVKQSRMMPPPAKVVNRACNGQQKFRKLMRMDWSRDSDRHD